MVVTGDSLRKVPIFASLNDEQLHQLAQAAQRESYAARAVLFADNDPARGLYIVQSGRVALGHRSPEREQIIRLLGPGELLDVAPLIDGHPHVWMAWAVEPSLVYRLDTSAVLELLETNPAFRETLLGYVAAELRSLAGVVGDLTLKDVAARIAGVLLQYASEDGVQAGARVTIARTVTARELAARSGTVREVAQRTLRRLEDAGLITHHSGQITILDMARLRHRAAGYPLPGEPDPPT